jgi:hypothetical protein
MHEPLDLGAQRFDLPDPHHVVVAIELDESRSRDSVGHVARRAGWTDGIAVAAQYEYRHMNVRKKMTDIDELVHSVELGRCPRARAGTLIRSEALGECLVAVGGEKPTKLEAAPVTLDFL